ncbi:MAG TPA: branched-chain amino acid aminotransferase [Terriglobales bacterium]|nr:branched-chain amino acid aminotransferase [Terriglobales bacterium]
MPGKDAIAARIRVECVTNSGVKEVDFTNIPFGSVFSDHMFTAEYQDGRWSEGIIRPFGPIPLSPTSSSLHYGISVFEGMKAHKSADGHPLLFRPRDNARRFQGSAARLAMAQVPEDLFLDGLHELIRLDQAWIPPADKGALYIRPVLFSSDPSLRVKPADKYQFIIFTSPFGAYFSVPVDVLVSEHYVRAFPGGTGDVKPAGNYAAALLADQEAREAGCHAVLWLDAQEHRFVEECGVMNVFFLVGEEVITPPLTGTILPGITRDSVITLLRDMGIPVREERISIDELLESHEQGCLRECFGTGTAATVSHVGRIRYRGNTLLLPPVEERKIGPAVRQKLVSIMTGREPDPHAWVEAI